MARIGRQIDPNVPTYPPSPNSKHGVLGNLNLKKERFQNQLNFHFYGN